MGLSQLSRWNLAWTVGALIFATLIGLGALWGEHTFREHIVVADWPDPLQPASPHTDGWRGGVFLDRPASRIRRVERWHGKYLDAEDIHYYACVPMPEQECEHALPIWKTDPEYKFMRYDSSFAQLPAPPSWFPKSPDATYVGTIAEPNSWHVDI